MKETLGYLLWDRLEEGPINLPVGHTEGNMILYIPYRITGYADLTRTRDRLCAAIRKKLTKLGIPVYVDSDSINFRPDFKKHVKGNEECWVEYRMYNITDAQWKCINEWRYWRSQKTVNKRDNTLLYQDDPIFKQL